MKKIKYNLFIYIYFLTFYKLIFGNWYEEKKHFKTSNEPIDIIIACHEKDKYTLDACIEHAGKFVKDARRIIVISEKKLSDKAEWFNEAQFPFSKESIANEFAKIDITFYENPQKLMRVGWYFKQIMNFYAAFVIPGISSNILILDADTIFIKPVEFIDQEGNMLHAPGNEHNFPYFEHMVCFLPGLKKVFSNYSGISHHMLFQKPILEDLFAIVESMHKMEFWKAYCICVNPKYLAHSGAADYEIYFNFMLLRTNQIKIRPLKWINIKGLYAIDFYKNNGSDIDFLSCHEYQRDDLQIEKMIYNRTKDANDNTALMLAAKSNNLPLAIAALKNSSKEFINCKNKDGFTALYLALMQGASEIAEALINHDADLNIISDIAVKHKNISWLHFLIRCDVSPKTFEAYFNKLNQQNPKIIQETLNNYGLSILHLVMRYQSADVFELLIKQGANIHSIDQNGFTALYLALMHGASEIVELLINHDVDLNIINDIAVKHKNINWLQFLITCDISPKTFEAYFNKINQQDPKIMQDALAVINNYGLSILHLAIRYQNADVFELLMKHGANMHTIDQDGNTPLLYAIPYGRKDIIQKIGSFYATKKDELAGLLNTKNNSGLTPLHLAAKHLDYEVCKLLVDLGANKRIKNNNQETPFEYAKKLGLISVLEFYKPED